MPMPRSERSSIAFAPRDALDHTLVVIASDHGESLGEHGERTHGLFAYDSTLRVPLILWAPAAIHRVGRRDTRTAGRRHADGPRSGRRRRAGRVWTGEAFAPRITGTIRAPISRRSTPISRGTGRRSKAW